MPTRNRAHRDQTEANEVKDEKEHHVIHQYIINQTVDRTTLIELGYVAQPYTSDDIQSCRDRLKPVAPHVTDVTLSHADLLDVTRPISIAQFLFAGLSWHTWYLDELERNLSNQTIDSVFDLREFLVSFNEFTSFFDALHDDNIITRTDLSELAELTLRCLAFYYFNKSFIFDPLLVFKQMINFGHGVYMCSFLQEELRGDEQEIEIATLINQQLQKLWREQCLLLFRANVHTTCGEITNEPSTVTNSFIGVPFSIRSKMYRHSGSISMNPLIRAMNTWMEMRLHHNMQRQLHESDDSEESS